MEVGTDIVFPGNGLVPKPSREVGPRLAGLEEDDSHDYTGPEDFLDALWADDVLAECQVCREERIGEVLGERTVLVQSTCEHPLPAGYARLVAKHLGPSSIHVHVRRVHDAALPAFDVVSEAERDLVSCNGNDPAVFQQGGRLVEVHGDRLVEVSSSRLRIALARASRWQLGGRFVDPPESVVRALLDLGDYRWIPEVARVVTTPVLGRDGSIVQLPGYHEASGLYYAPASGLEQVDIPATITEQHVRDAREFLLVESMGDFPFVSDADRANALGALLTPFLRDRIDGPTPLHTIDAPTMGTGKSMLASLICVPAMGRSTASLRWSASEEERRKLILGVLRSAMPAVNFDNVTGRIDSPALNMALTERKYSDRVLRTHDHPIAEVRCLWLMTANNAQFVGDVVRRVVPVRLDAGVERPYRRTGPVPGTSWRHNPLVPWAHERRAELVRAALVLCRWWVQEGESHSRTGRLGSFESYEAVVGGVLSAAGVSGFLENLERLDEADDTTLFARLLAMWFAAYGAEPRTSRELVDDGSLREQFEECGVATWSARSLGLWLGARRDVIADGMRLQRVSRRNSDAWRVGPA
jgi:hypothetical protein